MAEIAGLVIGVAALWQSCVQVYEVVDSTRQHGMEYELLSVKFEVERIRLLCWGEATGLSGIRIDRRAARSGSAGDVRLDPRLHREDVRSAVFRLLGCIQHVFDNAERLQDHYGLQMAPPAGAGVGDQGLQPSQSQRILNGVFERAYENLRRMARERQRTTPLTRRSVWAVRDRKKFEILVIELRGFNDSLESLFPDAKAKAAEAMKSDIDAAVQVRELRLLQEAAANQHQNLSDAASQRLEMLGVTESARTELLSRTQSDADTLRGGENAAHESQQDVNEELPLGVRQDGQQTTGEEAEPEMDELSRRLEEVDLFISKKNFGALTIHLTGPSLGLVYASAHAFWDGEKRDYMFPSYWGDGTQGFVTTTHAAFELYKKKKYMKKQHGEFKSPDSEDHVLLDPESHARFESVEPGTVTVEGYGLECWEFEINKPDSSKDDTILIIHADLPSHPARMLMRRIDELQSGTRIFGWNRTQDELDLREFVGTLGNYDPKAVRKPSSWIGDLYSLLNRTDIFADLTTTSSVGLEWTRLPSKNHTGLWDFMLQVIIGRELAVRLKHKEDTMWYAGFTQRILATLIISDRWLTNVRVILTDAKIAPGRAKGAETPEQKAEAENAKNKGNEALKAKEFQKAADLYTEAMKHDLANAVYACNRSAAHLGLEKYEEAEADAHLATLLDPKYAKAWSRLGIARLKRGHAERAKKAYERAIQVAGKDATTLMRQGLDSAVEKISETIKAINEEQDELKEHAIRSAYLDEDWEIVGKTIEFHSLVHEQQVEGLLAFAERMRWPYINEIRDYAEDIYSNIRSGATTNVELRDWLYGVILPGKWYAFKIMTALILCTPSIQQRLGLALYFDCGLSLPTRSYWRVRTALGRVLGCLPGVISLCGWIGPCPPVEFDPPEAKREPRHIRVMARRVAPAEHNPNSMDDFVGFDSSYYKYNATRIRPDEEMESYLAEMRDAHAWATPEPPIRDLGTYEIQSIRLKKLALPVHVAQKAANGEMNDQDVEGETEYRASITFKMDNNKSPVTYKLFTNPVFVTPPPCKPGPKGVHEVHMRELPRHRENVWSVERLKDYTAEGSDGSDVMVINATGQGAEVLARAWCSERGKCAVIRRAGGPCFVCSVRAASKGSLGTGVLIWTG